VQTTMTTRRVALMLAGVSAVAMLVGAHPASADSGRERDLIRRSVGEQSFVLRGDDKGNGHLYRRDSNKLTKLDCGPFAGAWGLWVDDVDNDDQLDLVVAMKKRARFDPVIENRLHVYALRGDRCVPLWRGSRLAGRFDKIAIMGSKLLALERVGSNRRRVARYRYTGFGYAVDKVLWSGAGEPPARLGKRFED
jgi:hypothetical protein